MVVRIKKGNTMTDRCYVSEQIAEYCNRDESTICWACENVISEDDESNEIRTEFDGIQCVCDNCFREMINEIKELVKGMRNEE